MIEIPVIQSDKQQLYQEITWSNRENNAFYEALKVEGLKSFSAKAGLVTCCDMRTLIPYWSTAKSVLDVGSGYGRILNYLVKNNFKGEVTAIERCNVLFESLKDKFNYCNNIDLLHTDISEINFENKRFDLILMLWSAFADFSPTEQPIILNKLASLLSYRGYLVIDTLPENVVPLQASKYQNQMYLTKINDATIFTYEPTTHEMRRYANSAGLINMNRLSCQTDIGRERWLYIFS